jgi:hypothetical protein
MTAEVALAGADEMEMTQVLAIAILALTSVQLNAICPKLDLLLHLLADWPVAAAVVVLIAVAVEAITAAIAEVVVTAIVCLRKQEENCITMFLVVLL